MKTADPTWPAPVGHPPVVGGYLVQGVRSRAEAGNVLDVVDSARDPLVLVLLSAGAGQDGAARDRFDQAVQEAGRQHPAVLLDLAGLGENPPWVALAPSTPQALPERLLAATLPRDADETPRAGPRFRLAWFDRGWGVRWAPWLGTKAPPAWRRLWWLLGLVALLVLLALLLSMCQPPTEPEPAPAQPSPTSSEPAPSQGADPSPGPRPDRPGQGDGEGEDGQSANSRRALPGGGNSSGPQALGPTTVIA